MNHDQNYDFAYDKAFSELNEACSALRGLLVTMKKLGILKASEVQPLFKGLKRKYFSAHMNRQHLGVQPGYLPKKLER